MAEVMSNYEGMVTRFSSISNRNPSNALKILTSESDKCMVAKSDDNEFHRMIKKHILTNLLGPNAQQRSYQKNNFTCCLLKPLLRHHQRLHKSQQNRLCIELAKDKMCQGQFSLKLLRKHSPVPIVSLRSVQEDTKLGGYYIPAGSLIAISIYGCNMDKSRWEDPHKWILERFLDEKYDPMDLYKTMAFGAGKKVCRISSGKAHSLINNW
ncbi:hypothetical protein VNO77_07341 [Canavalia gladiata]|uniref:Cytochrome P450 n=1 Tax=Canavalia gladiata TaxID=3824 RepID=A0AAN9QVS3_CANGL